MVGVPVLTALLGGYERTGGGEIAVVRNGGFFDDNKIRQVIDPASGRTWTGLYSKIHRYPAQQRFYTITSEAKKAETSGVDVVTVPSADGVNMGIEGTLYFTLNQDHKVLREFDDKFGTRKFRAAGGESLHAWEGEEGWLAFLDQIVRPVIVLEHVDLYTSTGKGPVDDLDYCIPIGRAAVRRTGSRVTVLTYLAMTPRVLEIADEADAEVIDLR
ncbi:SPFH domain-containing protein, partial [Actinomadura adrarensis]